jgi:hypothetical protein
MPKLKLTIEIEFSDYKDPANNQVTLKTTAQRDGVEGEYKYYLKTLHESTSTHKHNKAVELEHYLASAADTIEAALKLHGNEFGS